MQAIKILFPSSRTGSFGVKDQAEEEYEMEMLERLRRVRFFFLLIDQSRFDNATSSTMSHFRRQIVRSTWKV
jgi:hypothetical protein